jgi:hypothetical protein
MENATTGIGIAMMRLFRRRTFLLNKKFQFSLLKISLSYCLLLLAVTGISLFLPLMIALDGYEHQAPEAFQAARQILYLHENFWPAVLLCLFVTAIHSIRTSHRIAGPLYRLNLIFKRIRDGVLPGPLRSPRKGDYLRDELDHMNEMLVSLRAKVEGIQGAHRQLSRALDYCSEIADSGARDRIIEYMTEVKEQCNQLGDKIGGIHLEPLSEDSGPLFGNDATIETHSIQDGNEKEA